MKKFILFIFVIFISSNVYGAEINFSKNNDFENREMCVETMFYIIPVEFCRPISPWGNAIVKNATIKEVYSQMKALLKESHPLYLVLSDNIPKKDTKIIIDVEAMGLSSMFSRISTRTGIQDLSGEVIYTIKPSLVNITIKANDGVEAKIEFMQHGKDVIINKDSEYLDFLVENNKYDDEGFPYFFETEPHNFYGGKENIWVDYIYLSDIKTKSGTVYKDVPIFFHKHPMKAVMKNTSIKDVYYKLDRRELPSVGTSVENIGNKCYDNTYNKNKYIWGINGNSVGIISTSCETDNLYNYFYVQNGKDVEVYFLPIDWSL